MKIYGTPPTRVIKALWLLNELQVEYELVPVALLEGEHLRPEFRELNPASKVPVLVDGDLVLPESAAIALYLAEKPPEAGFIPETLEERAQMHRWLYFLNSEVEANLWRIAKHEFIYPEENRLAAEVALATKDLLEMLKVLESHMQDREFLVSGKVSVADFVAAYLLDWANEAVGLSDLPHLSSFLSRMYERPNAPPRISESMV